MSITILIIHKSINVPSVLLYLIIFFSWNNKSKYLPESYEHFFLISEHIVIKLCIYNLMKITNFHICYLHL